MGLVQPGRMMRRLVCVIAIGFALGASGCAARYLSGPNLGPNAEIPNTPVNEEIVRFVAAYEDILERRAFAEIAPLVSRDYYENGGTTDRTDDDYGHAGVALLLESVSAHIEDMRVELRVHDIQVSGERADVFMEFGLTMLYRVGEESRWQTARDVNRLQLQREENVWKIVSGL